MSFSPSTTYTQTRKSLHVRVFLESPQPASKNNATSRPGRVLATEPSPLAHGAQVSPKTALFEYHYGRNPHGTSHVTRHLNAF